MLVRDVISHVQLEETDNNETKITTQKEMDL
jgi:hypothetical protein